MASFFDPVPSQKLIDVLIERGVLVETDAYCTWGGKPENHFHEYVKNTYGTYENQYLGMAPVNCDADQPKPLYAIDEVKLNNGH